MVYCTFQTKGLSTRAKKNWNCPDKKCNGSEHGPQKTEEGAKLFTHCIFDDRTDRASEITEADQYLKEGECLHIRKEREKWVQN